MTTARLIRKFFFIVTGTKRAFFTEYGNAILNRALPIDYGKRLVHNIYSAARLFTRDADYFISYSNASNPACKLQSHKTTSYRKKSNDIIYLATVFAMLLLKIEIT